MRRWQAWLLLAVAVLFCAAVLLAQDSGMGRNVKVDYWPMVVHNEIVARVHFDDPQRVVLLSKAGRNGWECVAPDPPEEPGDQVLIGYICTYTEPDDGDG